MPDDAVSASGGGLRRQPSIRDRMRLFEQRASGALGSISDTPTPADGKRPVGSLPREMTARIEAQMDIASARYVSCIWIKSK
jgi:hypothetical protein